MLVYGLMRRRRLGLWAAHLLIPVAVIAAYCIAARALYGINPLTDAAVYSQNKVLLPARTGLAALTFTGACIAVAFFFAPRLWSRWGLLAWAGAAVAAIAALSLPGQVPGTPPSFDDGNAWPVAVQTGTALVTGLSILLLAAWNLKRRPDADSVLLFSWIMGTFAFVWLINWTVSARVILPMAPAVAIILMIRIHVREQASPTRAAPLAVPLILAGLLSLSVAAADWATANAGRTAANRVCDRYLPKAGSLWFQGHWGFQYYMQKRGAKAIDVTSTIVPPGDYIAMPLGNTDLTPVPEKLADTEDILEIQTGRLIGTVRASSGAGFYSSLFGALPYVIAPQTPQTYWVFAATCPIDWSKV
jgi:hypothetical protein